MASPNRPFQRDRDQFLRFNSKLHRQFLQHFLAEPIHNKRDGLFFIHAALAAIEQLIVIHFGRRRLMLYAG